MTSIPSGAARRKPAEERRADMIRAAAEIAIEHGLEKVTAKRVASALGVFPGLVSHYFTTADDLVAAAFTHGVQTERADTFGQAETVSDPVQQMRRLLAAWLSTDRDAVSLLWLDAWQASRRRPALADAVARQMSADISRVSGCVQRGAGTGQFLVSEPARAAVQILSLIDGLSVQAATRDTIDYSDVRAMVIATTERILGLADGGLGIISPESPGH